MAILSDTKQIGKLICKSLGLDANKIKGIDIHFHVGAVATVDIEYYPNDEIQKIAPILKKYRLELIDDTGN